jgi:hypothetical protein
MDTKLVRELKARAQISLIQRENQNQNKTDKKQSAEHSEV